MGLAVFLIGVGVLLALSTIRPVPPAKTIEGCKVQFSRTHASFTIEPPKPFPPRLSIRPALHGFAIDGEERWLAAKLGTEMSSSIDAIGSRVWLSIENGRLTATSRKLGGSAELDAALGPAIEIVKRLSEEIDVPAQIAHNAKHDAMSKVRQHCLEILIRDRMPSSKQIAAELLHDVCPEVRLTAARHVGAKAVSVFWSLAIDAGVPEGVRASAIDDYVRYEMFDDVRGGLRQLLARDQPPRVVAAIAKGIAKIGGDFEAELIRILGIDDRRAQVEATIALARIGTIACVEPLLSLAKRSDTPDEIRSLARRTVTRIQNAVRGEGGRLSVVQEEGEGKLSVAGASGELSVKDDGSGES